MVVVVLWWRERSHLTLPPPPLSFSQAAGLLNLDEIVDDADGVMIARGNLGMDIAAAKVSLAQVSEKGRRGRRGGR